MDLPLRHPVVLHLTDTGEPYARRHERECYEVVTIGSLDSAEAFLEHAAIDLAVVETSAANDSASVRELRRRLANVPIVLIPRAATPTRENGRPADARSAGPIGRDWLPTEVARALAGVLGLANAPHLVDGLDDGESSPPAAGHLSPEIARTVAFLQVNFWREDMSLATLAKHAFMSRYHFSRTFRRETGVRYIDYLTRVRLGTAIKLLADPGRSITEICFEIGYNDLTHFERTFKRHMGTTPSNYRARLFCGRDAQRAEPALAAVAPRAEEG